MEREEKTVRVWAGLDLLQAKMMEQVLLDRGIECFSNRDLGVLPAGVLGEIGLWVSEKDEQQARTLLEQMEEEMSEALDAEDDTPQEES